MSDPDDDAFEEEVHSSATELQSRWVLSKSRCRGGGGARGGSAAASGALLLSEAGRAKSQRGAGSDRKSVFAEPNCLGRLPADTPPSQAAPKRQG